MKIRTYFDKDNLIIRNSTVNLGKSPIAELYHGGATGTTQQYTRFLFHFSETDLVTRYGNGELGDLTKVSHTLKMRNTIHSDITLENFDKFVNKKRNSSFDLILFRITGFTWDEGVGYDYTDDVSPIPNSAFSTLGSNWVNYTSSGVWLQPGIYTGITPTQIGFQSFDSGSEDLSIDMTNEVNDIITGATTNEGYGIAYERDDELLGTTELLYTAFFTRHTQSYFEPYIETIYNNIIKDDREQFFKNKVNKLYLYSNLNGVPTNITNSTGGTINPGCYVYNDSGVQISAFTPSQVVQESTGVYSITLSASSSYTGCSYFSDVWTGITFNTVSVPNKTLKFYPINASEYYNVGDDDMLPKQYGFSVVGIKPMEKIKKGDKRKVRVSARVPYTVDQSEVIDNIQYRLYAKQGKNQIDAIDWTECNRSPKHNYFILDTSWLIPQIYYLDIKVTSNQEVRSYGENLKFEIVSITS